MSNVNEADKNEPSKVDQLHEQAARGIEALNLIVLERDPLRAQNDRLAAQIALLSDRNNQLEGRLKVVSLERDHYMRYCTEITTRLNNIQLMITSTVEESKHSAYKPTQIVSTNDREAVSNADVAKLENLLNRLPKNSGETQPIAGNNKAKGRPVN